MNPFLISTSIQRRQKFTAESKITAAFLNSLSREDVSSQQQPSSVPSPYSLIYPLPDPITRVPKSSSSFSASFPLIVTRLSLPNAHIAVVVIVVVTVVVFVVVTVIVFARPLYFFVSLFVSFQTHTLLLFVSLFASFDVSYSAQCTWIPYFVILIFYYSTNKV